MKTYQETVVYVAEQAACRYLAGGMGSYEGVDLVCFVYNKDEDTVYDDIGAAYTAALDKFRG